MTIFKFYLNYKYYFTKVSAKNVCASPGGNTWTSQSKTVVLWPKIKNKNISNKVVPIINILKREAMVKYNRQSFAIILKQWLKDSPLVPLCKTCSSFP